MPTDTPRGSAATLSPVVEGFCPYGHGRLIVWEHPPARLVWGDEPSTRYGACFTCRASWRATGRAGIIHAVACVPGDHTCGGSDA